MCSFFVGQNGGKCSHWKVRRSERKIIKEYFLHMKWHMPLAHTRFLPVFVFSGVFTCDFSLLHNGQPHFEVKKCLMKCGVEDKVPQSLASIWRFCDGKHVDILQKMPRWLFFNQHVSSLHYLLRGWELHFWEIMYPPFEVSEFPSWTPWMF